MSEYAVYLDDSGHPSDQPFVVVAGFLSTETRWLEFEHEWQQALHQLQLGSIFHMSAFENLRRKDCPRALERLTGIITAHTEAMFGVLVDMVAYRSVNNDYPLEEGIGTPYALACRGVAKQINEWKQEFFKPGDHLLVFVEDGTKHRGDMEECLRRDGIPVPQIVPKSHPRVQPADLLAWEFLHLAKHRDNRRSLRNLLSVNPVKDGIFRKEDLLRCCKEAGLRRRQEMPANLQLVYHSSPNRTRRRTIRG